MTSTDGMKNQEQAEKDGAVRTFGDESRTRARVTSVQMTPAALFSLVALCLSRSAAVKSGDASVAGGSESDTGLRPKSMWKKCWYELLKPACGSTRHDVPRVVCVRLVSSLTPRPWIQEAMSTRNEVLARVL